MSGIALENEGEEHILGTVGPMSTSLYGIELFMKVVLAAKPWLSEPSLVPLPWDVDAALPQGPKIKIGVLKDDGIVQLHPPVTAALNRVTTALKAVKNIEVVEWHPYKHGTSWEIIVRSTSTVPSDLLTDGQ